MAQRLLALSLALVAGLVLWFSLGTDPRPKEPVPNPDTQVESPDNDPEPERSGSRSELGSTEHEAAADGARKAEPPTSEPVVEPGAGTEVLARVVDRNDRPVSAALVILRRISVRDDVLERTVTTDAEGRFRFTEIPAGERLSLAIDGGSSGRLERWLRRSPAPGQRLDLGVIRLRPVTVVTGRVVETDDSPIPDALVRFSTLPASTLAMAPVHRTRIDGPIAVLYDLLPTPVLLWSERMERLDRGLEPLRARTDSNGVFRLELPGGTAGQILIATDEGRSAIRAWNDQEDSSVEDIRLAPLVPASVRVLGRNGDPAVGAELRLAPVDGPAPVRVTTDSLVVAEDGSVALERFPTTRALPLLRTKPGLPWSVLEEIDVTDSTLVVPDTATLTLLFDQTSAQPTADEVEIQRGSGPLLQELVALGGIERVSIEPTANTESATLRYDSLPLGSYTIRVRSEDRSEWVGVVELEGDRTVEIIRTRSRALSLTIVDPDGLPVASAEVSALAPATDPSARPTTLRARSDSEGMVQWDQMPPTAVRILASSQLHGRAMAIAPPGTSSLELRLSGTGTLEGELLEVDDPGTWTIEVVPSADTAMGPTDDERLGAALWATGSATTRPESDGSFRFERLPTGPVRVEARRAPGTEGITASLLARSMSEAEATAETTILAKATQRVLLRPASNGDPTALGAKVEGTVRVDGQPAAGLVIAWSIPDEERPRTTRTDAEGSFALGIVPAGTRELEVYDLTSQSRFDNQPHLLWRTDLKIEVAADQDLEIGVSTGSLAGRVVDASGSPLAGQFVLAQGDLDLPRAPDADPPTSMTIVVTDADGTFEAKGLAPGRWKVRVRPTAAGTPGPQIEDLVLGGGSRIGDLELRIPE